MTVAFRTDTILLKIFSSILSPYLINLLTDEFWAAGAVPCSPLPAWPLHVPPRGPAAGAARQRLPGAARLRPAALPALPGAAGARLRLARRLAHARVRMLACVSAAAGRAGGAGAERCGAEARGAEEVRGAVCAGQTGGAQRGGGGLLR